VSVVGNTQIIACSGRYCLSPGTLKATITAAAVRTVLGALVAPVVGTTSLSLPAGAYVLTVDGLGAGTKRYLGRGNYTISIKGPPVPVVPSCDAVRGTLLAQGYSNAQVEAMVDAMLAAVPPKCIDD